MKNSAPKQISFQCDVQSHITAEAETEEQIAAKAAAAQKVIDDKAVADKAAADKKAADDKLAADKLAAETAALPKTLDEAHAEIKRLMAITGSVPKWAQDRIDTITGNWRGTERERDALKAQVEQLKLDGKTVVQPTDDELNARATAIAAQRTFDDACIKVLTEGRKTIPDLDAQVQRLHNISPTFIKGANGASVPNMPRTFVEAVLEMDEPAQVLAELAKPANNDEAARIMALPPSRQGVALAKFAQVAQVAEARISRAEAPPSITIGGRSRSAPTLDNDKISTAEWMELRNKQLAEKRKRA